MFTRIAAIRFIFLSIPFVLFGCTGDDLRGVLFGHPSTHWSPPAGKTLHNVQPDLAACNYPAAAYFSCMKAKGYKAIELTPGKVLTEDEKNRIKNDRTFKTGLFALDQRTQDIFTGEASSLIGSKTASISLNGLRTNVKCHGNATLAVITSKATGSSGSANILCNDGRVITAIFVYESRVSGYGTGVDIDGVKYKFIFGKFKVDETILRDAFKKRFKDKKVMPKGLGA